MKKAILLATVVAIAISFVACTEDGINDCINNNVDSKSTNIVNNAVDNVSTDLGFYLIGGDGSAYLNEKLGIAQDNKSQQRHTNPIRCNGSGRGCTADVIVTAPKPHIMEAFASLDHAINSGTVNTFFSVENKPQYELIFKLSTNDLFNLRNNVITLGKDTKESGKFAYYIAYTNDPEQIYIGN